jgi:hypothetical protein
MLRRPPQWNHRRWNPPAPWDCCCGRRWELGRPGRLLSLRAGGGAGRLAPLASPAVFHGGPQRRLSAPGITPGRGVPPGGPPGPAGLGYRPGPRSDAPGHLPRPRPQAPQPPPHQGPLRVRSPARRRAAQERTPREGLLGPRGESLFTPLGPHPRARRPVRLPLLQRGAFAGRARSRPGGPRPAPSPRPDGGQNALGSRLVPARAAPGGFVAEGGGRRGGGRPRPEPARGRSSRMARRASGLGVGTAVSGPRSRPGTTAPGRRCRPRRTCPGSPAAGVRGGRRRRVPSVRPGCGLDPRPSTG